MNPQVIHICFLKFYPIIQIYWKGKMNFVLLLFLVWIGLWMIKIQYVPVSLSNSSIVRFPIENFPLNNTETDSEFESLGFRIERYPVDTNNIYIVVSAKDMPIISGREGIHRVSELEIDVNSHELLREVFIEDGILHSNTNFFVQCENSIFDIPTRKRDINYILEGEGALGTEPSGNAVKIDIPFPTSKLTIRYEASNERSEDTLLIVLL